jgi:hypothetical protein
VSTLRVPCGYPVRTLAVRHVRTSGGACAQQLAASPAGAGRVRVEVRIDVEVEAAPRVPGVLVHRRHGLARGGRGGAARRLGLDPHGARRALVAAVGTGHVRACARRHRTARPLGHAAAAAHPSDPSGTGSTCEYLRVPPRYTAAACCPPALWSPHEYP